MDLDVVAASVVISGLGAWLARRRIAKVLPIREVELEAALAEQQRRETLHPTGYRYDQRVRAIQQRLSRKFGRRAWTDSTQERVKKALQKHTFFGDK